MRPERPRLRNLVLAPYAPPSAGGVVSAESDEGLQQENQFLLEDPEGFAPPLVLPVPLAVLVSMMDGTRTLDEIAQEFQHTLGESLKMSDLEQIVEQFDTLHFLDSPAFEAFLKSEKDAFCALENRPAAMVGGAYEAAPAELEIQIRAGLETPRKIQQAEGSGTTLESLLPENLRAAVIPHLDMERGAVAYGWGYAAIAERCDADTFLIFASSHNPMNERFALTAKGFETPLGVLETDTELVREIETRFRAKYASKPGTVDLFADEFVHRDEHSIEFQTNFLKYLENTRNRKIRIVPILTGSFAPLVKASATDGAGNSPADDPAVQVMLETLREILDEAEKDGRKIAMLASANLSHVGPMFGSAERVGAETQDAVREYDNTLLERMKAGDAEGFWAELVKTQDQNNVCGIAPIYLLLKLLESRDGAQGVLLDYEQSVDEQQLSCVSFATLVY